VHIDEIGSYGINYVRSKARELVGKHGFTWSNFENLQQDMLLDLVQRLRRFVPGRSPRNAFITRVVKHKVADIIARRMSPSREHVRNEVSINAPLEPDGRRAELGDTLCGHQAPCQESDLAMDLELALASLPDDLRSLWGLRVQGLTFTEISLQLGVPRPTIYDRWAKLAQHLRASLGEYFDEDRFSPDVFGSAPVRPH